MAGRVRPFRWACCVSVRQAHGLERLAGHRGRALATTGATTPGVKSSRTYEPRPAGWRTPRDAVAWRTHARLLVEELAGRRDLRATLHAVVDELAVRWHPRTQTSGPGHDQLAAAVAVATGRGRCNPATVTRAIARLTEWSLVWEAAPGTIVVGGDGLENLRAEYGLALPPITAIATRADGDVKGEASATPSSSPTPPEMAPSPQDHPAHGRWSLVDVPAVKAQRLAAARRLQFEAPSLRGCSVPALAAVLREWFVAGWSPRDVLTALDFKPGAEGAWTFTTSVRSVVGWVGYRLAAWRDEAGRPVASPAQRAAAVRAAERARHAELIEPVADALVDEQKAAAVARCRAAVKGPGISVVRGGPEGWKAAVLERGDRLLVGSRNADPSSSFLSVGESLRARGPANDGTPDGVRVGANLVKAALAAARQAQTKAPRRARPTLAELHSEGISRLW